MKTNTEIVIELLQKMTNEGKKLCLSIIEKMLNDPEYNKSILSWDGNPDSIPMP